jgi:hypothetical protein
MPTAFSYKVITENEQFTFDFSPAMGTGETITASSSTVLVVSGTDASPTSILQGSPVVSGQQVAQRVYGGLDGVIYRIQMTVTTSAANTLVLLADLQILAPLSV